MKLRIIWIGKTKNSDLAALASDYASRIRRFLPVEITELKDARRETEKLLEAIDSTDRVVVLDDKGSSWTSAQFAAFLAKHMRQDARRLTFVIGGHSGLAEPVKQRADHAWALSPLTYTHDMTRMILLEQIYRALTIIHHHPYPR